jgi:hypothetical protein
LILAGNVNVKEGEEPAQKLDEGEHIVKKVVELDKLMEELQGKLYASVSPTAIY